MVQIWELDEHVEIADRISCLVRCQANLPPALAHTPKQIFFGTPHRSYSDLPWYSILSKLFCDQYHANIGPWLPQVVHNLSDYHEQVAYEFERLGQNRTFRLINFYQEEPKQGDYEIVSPSLHSKFLHAASN